MPNSDKIPKPQLIGLFKQALLYSYKSDVKVKRPEFVEKLECETKSAAEIIEAISNRFTQGYCIFRPLIVNKQTAHWELSIDVPHWATGDKNEYFLYLKLRTALAENLFEEYGVEVDKNYYRIEP